MSAAATTPSTPVPEDVVRSRVRVPDTDVEIALQDWGGDGPVVLMHHANGFCGAMWAEVASALRERFHFVALDARGHGDSTLPGAGVSAATFAWSQLELDLIHVADTVLERTGAPRIALGLGHSFGGTLTFAAASDRPDLFERLLLLDPVIFPAMDEAAGRRHAEESGMSKRARRRRAVWANRAEARAYCHEKPMFADWTPTALELYLHEGMRESASGIELKCPPAVEAQIFAGPHTLDVFAKAARVVTPTEIQWARKGNFSRGMYESLLAPVPEGRIEDVDAGHLILMEQPALVIASIERLLAG